MSRVRSLLIDGLTVVTALAAIAVAWSVLTQRQGPADERDRRIEGFEELASTGHRIGAEDPEVTVVVFTDYECPVCRGVEPRLAEFVATYPEQVALVYRHWPLSYHPSAYPAAVAVECAADQGAFEAFHASLFEDEDWMGGRYETAFLDFAESAGIDSETFANCFEENRPGNAKVDADVAAAESFGARGTPAILVNGVYVGRMPADLELATWAAIGS